MKRSFFNSENLAPRPVAEIFPFFGNARNLEIITTRWLQFEILTEGPNRDAGRDSSRLSD